MPVSERHAVVGDSLISTSAVALDVDGKSVVFIPVGAFPLDKTSFGLQLILKRLHVRCLSETCDRRRPFFLDDFKLFFEW